MADDDLTEEDAPPAYPPSFRGMFFSFKGRLDRETFWLRGAFPLLAVFLVVQLLLGGIATYGLGVSFYGVGGPKIPEKPWVKGDFKKAGKNIVGTINVNTGPARLSAKFKALEATMRVEQTIIVGGRRLKATVAKNKNDPGVYDMDFRWTNYPKRLPEKPTKPRPSRLMQVLPNGVSFIFILALLWPAFAIGVKRLKDRDMAGWWSLIGIIPLVGQIWALVTLGFFKGTDGENRFGPDPLES
ncbi:MAG: DUF805 domain-containing protein [Rhodospirillales bacterium]|nr:DUF805 domain-containing protein [Rhodospirillales bacterium]